MHLQLRVALGESVLPSNIPFNFRLTKIEEEIICMKVQSIRVNKIHIGGLGISSYVWNINDKISV